MTTLTLGPIAPCKLIVMRLVSGLRSTRGSLSWGAKFPWAMIASRICLMSSPSASRVNWAPGCSFRLDRTDAESNPVMLILNDSTRACSPGVMR